MPTNGQDVKIAHYTRSKFDSLTNKDSATIYYVEETDGKIKQYIGNTHVVSDLNDVVKLSGAQTISGEKTFNDGIIIPGSNKYIDLGNKNNWFWTRFSGENWSFNNTYTSGGWARNLMEMKDAEGNAYLRIGAQGSGQSFSQMYIGPAYNNYWLSLNNTRALFGTKPQYASDPTDNNDLTRKLYVDNKIDTKVDKVEGKGLSTNDYTTTEKNKLAGIASGAEVNVQSDWNATSGDALILNKPTIPTKVSDLTNDTEFITGYTETDPIFTAWNKSTGISITKSQVSDLIEASQSLSGLMSATDKTRLDVLHSLLEEDTANNVVDSINEVLAIFNNYPEGADLVTALAGKVDKVSGKGLSTNDYTTTEKNKLAGIATGAEVNVQSNWNATSGDAFILNKPNLATVATSGSYNDLSNKPTIPAAQVQSNWNATTGMGVILNKPALKTVATTGSYNDLTNKPTIPAAQVASNWNSTSGVTQILNKPNLATVATSGSYNDLSNKPSIPSAYTLTKAEIDTVLSGSSSGSIQLGQGASAPEQGSTALGLGADALGDSSTALGGLASALGTYSTAIGQGATASTGSTTAIGRGAKALGANSIAIGVNTEVTEDNVVDFGSSRQVRVNETPVDDRDAVSKKHLDNTVANITPSGTWKEVYSGPSGVVSKTSYNILTLNETAIYYNRPMMMEIRFGNNSITYTHQIVTFNLGSDTSTTPSKTRPRVVSITEFDGQYSKTTSVKVYVPSTGTTNELRVGQVKTLIGDFTGTSGTLTWTTQDSLSVYIGKIWVME